MFAEKYVGFSTIAVEKILFPLSILVTDVYCVVESEKL